MTESLAEDLHHVTTQVGSAWEELRQARLFVTGGTGFFGCWILESFLHANRALNLNASMTVLTRRPEAFREKAPHLANDPAITLLAGDVRDFPFPTGRFSHVIHAATESTAKLYDDDPAAMIDTMLAGMRRVLDFSASRRAGKLLFTSSGAVYGRQPPELPRVPEDYAGGPDCLDVRQSYAEAKRMSEMLCALHSKQHGIEIKIARGFAFVGPHLPLDAHFAIGNFIRDGMRGGPIRVNGDGTPLRSYLYAADMAVWLWTILLCGKAGRAYNVGSDQAVSIAELANTVAVAFTPSPNVEIAETPAPGATGVPYVPSIDRAAFELGLRVRIDLPDAIRRTLAWHRTS